MSIRHDSAVIELGADGDVVMQRQGDGLLALDADVNVTGSLLAGEVSVNGDTLTVSGSDVTIQGSMTVNGSCTCNAAPRTCAVGPASSSPAEATSAKPSMISTGWILTWK